MGENSTVLRANPVAVPGLRAAAWIEARHFFSRADAQDRCWLWLLRGDGRVHALWLDAARHGRTEVAVDLGRRFAAQPDLPIAANQPHGPAWPLPGAPVVPLPRWTVSWGHPVQHAIRAFAAQLDQDVLDALGRLEVPGPFFGSVGNYNQLALLPDRIRRHRLQALAEFPPLVAPLLLDLHERPDMFGTDEDLPSQCLAFRRESAQAVLDAMDRGRDLIGALATHYRIGRALVRSPLFREPWSEGQVPHEALRLLDAMPAHARPRSRPDVEERMRCLHALPARVRDAQDVRRLARMFTGGWSETWRTLERCARRALEPALRDTRDFLRAALEQVEAPPALLAMNVETLGLAWLARRGGVSLLEASRRWHAQPVVQQVRDDECADAVSPILGDVALSQGSARELVTRSALVAEGDAMHHCVGSYWNDCVLEGFRIVHLADAQGEQATAMYAPIEVAGEVRFALDQLRGPCNEEAGEALRRLAEAVLERMNGDDRGAARQSAFREAAIAASRRDGRGTLPTTLRRLDLRSRRETLLVLAWCATQHGWQARANPLFRGAIAGFAHAEGPRLVARLQAGDGVTLVREPANPHDPRAVRIEWNGFKLGYIPRTENAEIARRMDAGEVFDASILTIHRDRGYWNAVELELLPA